jgi:phenylpropionate dioxygenase-like ring-hydroxylating dioxygenase large terminal subunit
MKFEIPNCPKSWHFVGNSDLFTNKKATAVTIYKQEYLVYRDTKGKLVAMKKCLSSHGSKIK